MQLFFPLICIQTVRIVILKVFVLMVMLVLIVMKMMVMMMMMAKLWCWHLAVLMRGDEPCELPLPSVTSIIYHLLHTGRNDDQAFVHFFRFKVLFILRS